MDETRQFKFGEHIDTHRY